MTDSPDRPLARIRTGSFERRLSLTRTGLLAGTRYVARSAGALLAPRAERERRRRAALDAEARYLANELGKLKGSVVKIGQAMALYGEHFLPEEITAALHTLEDRTVALEWPVIRRELQRELGRARLAELEIDPVPIAAASLGQVHLARRRADQRAICLKVQYPGVAQSIDSDIDAVAALLRIGRLVGAGREFGAWLEEVRAMLHREVDYTLEAAKTRLYHDRLRRDPRFVVPQPLPGYSSAHVLATSFEQGFGVTSADVEALEPERRNGLGRAFLELFLREVFEWRELQTDPNFGNYRIRPASGARGRDRLVLLDFGAVQEFPESFLGPFAEMIRGAWHGDTARVMAGALALGFMRPEYPESVQRSFAEVCMGVIEPLVAARRRAGVPASALSAAGGYRWRESDLPTRIARRAARAAFSPHFTVPPREFVFLNRKLIGVYTFIAVLGAEFDGADLIERYM
jgi:predicted unusual protein kinase regulating ubiquinone biosynthesis (AarF/ABC1/UbiB family)